jgi:hypothetical protein
MRTTPPVNNKKNAAKGRLRAAFLLSMAFGELPNGTGCTNKNPRSPQATGGAINRRISCYWSAIPSEKYCTFCSLP